MSVGLYARKDFFEIPNPIAKLYQTMIEEMLDRQRFKRDPGGNALAFQVDDKYRFLREFALHSAVGPEGFNDFERRTLAAFAGELAPRLNAVSDPDAFVKELRLISDGGMRISFVSFGFQRHGEELCIVRWTCLLRYGDRSRSRLLAARAPRRGHPRADHIVLSSTPRSF